MGGQSPRDMYMTKNTQRVKKSNNLLFQPKTQQPVKNLMTNTYNPEQSKAQRQTYKTNSPVATVSEGGSQSNGSGAVPPKDESSMV